MKKDYELLSKQVVIKSDNADFQKRIKSMILETTHLQIVSESTGQIVVVSTGKAKSLEEMFPQITPIKPSKNRISLWKYKTRKNYSPRRTEIISMSGILLKK